MTQPSLDFTAAPDPPSSATTSPSAVQARRSGRQRGRQSVPQRALDYMALLSAHGPLTDHEAAELMGRPLSVVNAIRGEIRDWALTFGRETPVVAHSRVRQVWAHGRATSRVRWTVAV
jgi:hypothetical protein